MFIVDLVCDAGHLFEGWYDNKEAFDDVRDGGALRCPTCGDAHVEQRPSFKGIVSRSSSMTTTKKKPAAPPTSAASTAPSTASTAAGGDTAVDQRPMPLELQRALSQLIKLVKANSDDVGDRFAAQALAMHRGDAAPASIHGTSTPEERETLRDEGVPFASLPVPEIDNN